MQSYFLFPMFYGTNSFIVPFLIFGLGAREIKGEKRVRSVTPIWYIGLRDTHTMYKAVPQTNKGDQIDDDDDDDDDNDDDDEEEEQEEQEEEDYDDSEC